MLAIIGGTVLTMAGPTLPAGTVLVEGGNPVRRLSGQLD
jgi:hypothetical protein